MPEPTVHVVILYHILTQARHAAPQPRNRLGRHERTVRLVVWSAERLRYRRASGPTVVLWRTREAESGHTRTCQETVKAFCHLFSEYLSDIFFILIDF